MSIICWRRGPLLQRAPLPTHSLDSHGYFFEILQVYVRDGGGGSECENGTVLQHSLCLMDRQHVTTSESILNMKRLFGYKNLQNILPVKRLNTEIISKLLRSA